MKIYLVEDEEAIRQEVKQLLTQYGYEVLESLSFENIKEEILADSPDLILMMSIFRTKAATFYVLR